MDAAQVGVRGVRGQRRAVRAGEGVPHQGVAAATVTAALAARVLVVSVAVIVAVPAPSPIMSMPDPAIVTSFATPDADEVHEKVAVGTRWFEASYACACRV